MSEVGSYRNTKNNKSHCTVEEETRRELLIKFIESLCVGGCIPEIQQERMSHNVAVKGGTPRLDNVNRRVCEGLGCV